MKLKLTPLTFFVLSTFLLLNSQTGLSQCANTVTGILSSSAAGGASCDFTAEITVVPTGGNGNYCFGYSVLVDGVAEITEELASQSGVLDITEMLNADCDAMLQVSWYSFTSPQCNGTQCNSGILDLDLAAPIELIYFSGKATERTNMLTWSTSSEENVSTFVIEKSSDGIAFDEVVGSQKAAGFSTTNKIYQLEDISPSALSYYRLRSIDFDGYEMLSSIVSVERNISNAGKMLSVTPVPLRKGEDIQLNYTASNDEKIILLISDITGRKLYEERMQLDKGIHHWNIELAAYDQNLLIVQLYGKNGIETQMIPIIHTH